MKHSLIITYYDPQCLKLRMMADLLDSIKATCSRSDIELIIVKDAKSYTDAVNEGLARATGDYLIVMNDDITCEEDNWLERFAIPDTVTTRYLRSDIFMGKPFSIPDAAVFCIPRSVYELVGGIDPRYAKGANFEDTDYFLEMQQKGIQFMEVPVDVSHIGNVTTKLYFNDVHEALRNRNHFLFHEKWQQRGLL